MEPTARPEKSPGLDTADTDEVTDTVDPARLFAEAATSIHAERDTGTVVDWVLDRCLEATGADTVGLWLQMDGTMTWTRAGSPHVEPAVLGDVRMWPSLAGALEAGAIVYADDLSTDGAAFDLRRLFGGASLVVVPLRFPSGDPQGALVLVRRDPRAVGDEAIRTVSALCDHLAVALENLSALHRLSDLEAAQRGVVRQLQEAVFTPAPTVPHTELGMHYVASDESAPTGG